MHAFQQRLPHELTPTLYDALPAFEGLRVKWQAHQSDNPHLQHIIQPGLDKLEEYHDRTTLMPAYVLAMCE